MLACEDFLRLSQETFNLFIHSLIKLAITKKNGCSTKLADCNHHKCPIPHQRKTLSQLNSTLRALYKSQDWLAGPWPDWSFDNEISVYKEFLLKTINFLRAYYLGYV